MWGSVVNILHLFSKCETSSVHQLLWIPPTSQQKNQRARSIGNLLTMFYINNWKGLDLIVRLWNLVLKYQGYSLNGMLVKKKCQKYNAAKQRDNYYIDFPLQP